MKLKKSFSFSDKNQIWRLLISDNDQLIIETRNTELKEVFFHCIDIVKGKKVFKNLQLEEKYWLGIEIAYKGIIFFHSFAKPNMPEHKKIIAYNIEQNKIIWQNDQLAFLSLKDDKIYAFRKKFEGQDVFVIDYLTGNIIEELGNDFKKVNEVLEEVHLNEDFSNYKYPEPLDTNDLEVKSFIDDEIEGKDIAENIDVLKYENLTAFNYYIKNPNNSFDNMFVIYDIKKGKKVYADILNKNLNSFSPDSFFGYKNNILLLKNKNEIISYKLV
jgi:hypothetical protein